MGTRTIKPYSNNDGQIGSSSKYWNKGYFNTLHVNELHTSSTSALSALGISINPSFGIVFEGPTPDDFEIQLLAADPSADRIIILPNKTGTIALTSDVGDALSFDGSTVNGICTYKDADEILVNAYVKVVAASPLTYLQLLSMEDTGDMFTIVTTTNGATTISTTDDDTTQAHLTLNADGNIINDAHTGLYKWYKDGGSNDDDFLQLTIGTHGSASFGTTDADGNDDAHLTFDIDGNISLNSATKNYYFAGDGTNLVAWNLDTDNYKFMHSSNQNDYFNIEIGSEGATTITTVDADTTAAHLTLSADGNIILTTPDMHYSTSIKRRKMSVTSNTHNDHDGDVVYFGAASGVSQGDICFLSKDGSNNATWYPAVADQEAKSTSLLAISLGTDPATDGMLLRGMFTLDENTGDNNFGVPVYLSDTSAGEAIMTAPSDNNDVVRVIGYKMGNDDEIWFCPDNTWVVVSA